MRKKRYLKDGFLNALTYLSAGLATLVLVSIIGFVIIRGANTISWDMITSNYWSVNYKLNVEESLTTEFEAPENLSENVYYSSKYGIAIEDTIDRSKQKLVTVAYVHPDSLLNQTVTASKGEIVSVNEGFILQNITVIKEDGSSQLIGTQLKQDAQQVLEALESSTRIDSLFVQTPGGGIYGSIVATLMLIAISLLLALPIGIGAAIYLQEYAKDGLVTQLMRSCIEMLAGIPSIIFGLMGVAVLFPLTSLVGAQSISILLGGLTLAIMLLPIIIRQTEESLLVVPNGIRMASLSLGATKAQTIFKVILPSALPGILSAILLAISRVIGESAALIYTMGTTIVDKPEILKGATSLAVQIWQIMSGEQPNFELASAISLVILVLVLILNLSVKAISRRINMKWSA